MRYWLYVKHLRRQYSGKLGIGCDTLWLFAWMRQLTWVHGSLRC